MNPLVRLLAIFLSVLLLAAPAAAQKYKPQVGQAGKDVIWVPTPDEVVERMLTMAQVTPQDFVMDLGAGNGKIAIAAAQKFGARAVGIEYNPDMVEHANANARAAGVAGEGPGKALIRRGDIFQTDFSKATVITLYLLPALNMKLRPQLLSMRPGTRVVSHSFTMEDWTPDETSSVDGRDAYFWVVPANVQGAWTLEIGASDAAASAAEAAQVPVPPSPAPAPAQRYEVRRGDTLSRIAAERRAPGVTRREMQHAIYCANPQAFVGGDLDRLLAGVTLVIPAIGLSRPVAPAGAAVPAQRPATRRPGADGAQRLELAFEQTFQKIRGNVRLGPVKAGVREPRLRGAEIAFTIVDASGVRRDFTGRVDGRRMEGSFRDAQGAEGRWSAARR